MIKNATIPVETIYYNTRDENKIQEDLVGKMKEIGAGCYARVYGKSKTRVIKIGYSLTDSYLRFLEKVIQLKKPNPFLPRIYNLTFYKSKTNKRRGFYVVEMERLHSLQDKMSWSNIHQAVGQIESVLYHPKGVKGYLADIKRSFLGGVLDLADSIIIPDGLEEAVRVIQAAKKSSKHTSWDIHEYNVMMRKTQVVITDPLS
jgi:hypothetical protein